MQKVRVSLGDRSYDIIIGSGLITDIGRMIEGFNFSRRAALISNPTVYGLYGEKVRNSISEAGFDLIDIIIPDGEEYKNLASAKKIYEEMLRARLDRKSVIVALGGGVIGDIAGFAASTYMRGIDFVQVPTTLLAQVDSSVGGKTGVNHELGKNMIGTFWQPKLVLIDIETLKTLPRRQLLAGLSEVIKYGIIWDEDLFNFLTSEGGKILSLDAEALRNIIKRSCEIKAEVVSKDERESGLRAILNYGHTIGHAVETATNYREYLHGEAVSIGMRVEAELSNTLDLLDKKEVRRIISLLESYGLPASMRRRADMEAILSSMQLDKKAEGGRLKFILPDKIGSVKIHSGISADIVRKVCESFLF